MAGEQTIDRCVKNLLAVGMALVSGQSTLARWIKNSLAIGWQIFMSFAIAC